MDKEHASESERPRLAVVRGTPDVTALEAVNHTLRPLGLEVRREDLIDNFIEMAPDPVVMARQHLIGNQRQLMKVNAVATRYEVEARRRPIRKWKQRRAGNWRRHCIRLAVNVDHLKARLRAAHAEARARKLLMA